MPRHVYIQTAYPARHSAIVRCRFLWQAGPAPLYTYQNNILYEVIISHAFFPGKHPRWKAPCRTKILIDRREDSALVENVGN